METLLLSPPARKMEEIPGSELEELLNAVLSEAAVAAAHWDLVKRLDAAISGYGDEVQQSEDFWGFTLKAHFDVVLFYLGRLYAQEPCALSLGRLLSTVKLSGFYREEPVDRDLESVSLSDEKVERLNGLRNRMISYKALRAVRLPDLGSVGLSGEDIETLLERAMAIGNKYWLLRWRTPFSRQVVSGGDYWHWLSLSERGLKPARAEQAPEPKGMEEPPPAWSPADCLAALS